MSVGRRLRASLRVAAVATALLAASATRSGDEPQPVAGQADRDGYFTLDDATLGARAYAGPGVTCLVGGAGRIDRKSASPQVWVRADAGPDGESGAIDARPLVLTKSDAPLEDALVAAVAAWGRARGDPACRALADLATRAREEPVHDAPKAPWQPVVSGDARELPPDGADLARWAPLGHLFVRFRSVEAALRFSAIADRIAARLSAAAGDARDFGTLRWALHDLQLPEIWAANPETEKGVGECALVAVPRASGGRLECALVMRITDPELHRMQSEAGIGWAAMPGHRWRPDDDPDPESRPARRHRRVMRDVDVIATSDAMMRRMVEVRGTPTADLDGWKAARGAGPTPDEAVFAFLPAESREAFGAKWADATWTDRAWRQGLGVADLLRRWTGLERRAVPVGFEIGRGAAPGTAVAHLVSLRAASDAKGADVTVTFDDADAAEFACARLGAAAKPLENGAAPCRANRRGAFAVAVVERSAQDLAERCFVVLGWRPVCPCGGTYTAHPITAEVSCSVHGSDASPLPDPPPPAALLRDLRREGAAVRFRVPIDWR